MKEIVVNKEFERKEDRAVEKKYDLISAMAYAGSSVLSSFDAEKIESMSESEISGIDTRGCRVHITNATIVRFYGFDK